MKPPTFPYLASQHAAYIDYWSESDNTKEPVILEDGTSVPFPKHWTDEDADKWRKGMELQHPQGLYAKTIMH